MTSLVYLTNNVSIQLLNNNQKRVCKKLPVLNHNPQEIKSMITLKDKPNIIKYVGHEYHYENQIDYINLYMEYCEGGNLHNYIFDWDNNVNTIVTIDTESTMKQSKQILRQCLYGIKQCHDARIIHGDIKFKNFVFSNDINDIKHLNDLKLIDFGCSRKLSRDTDYAECSNATLLYTAPEMLRSHVYLSSDIWAIGVMVFYIMTTRFPFDYPTQYEIWRAILNKEINYNKLSNTMSSECIDFIKKTLTKDPEKRMSVYECLDHKWIQ